MDKVLFFFFNNNKISSVKNGIQDFLTLHLKLNIKRNNNNKSTVISAKSITSIEENKTNLEVQTPYHSCLLSKKISRLMDLNE
jgi:hypothetical protein